MTNNVPAQRGPAPLLQRRQSERALYHTAPLRRIVRVAYPRGAGGIVLRTELDWEKNLQASSVDEEGISSFEVEAHHPFLYFKPCLVQKGLRVRIAT